MAQRIGSVVRIFILTCMILMGLTLDGYPEQESKQPESPGMAQPPTQQPSPVPLRKQRVGLQLIADMTVSPLSHTGPCPARFTFKGQIYANKAITIHYRFVRSDNTRTQARILSFEEPGRQEVTDTWEIGDVATGSAFSGWEVLQVLTPVKVQSNEVYFKGSCSAQENRAAGELPGQLISQPTDRQEQGVTTDGNCVSFDPGTIIVQQNRGQWSIVDGTRRLFSFGIDKIEAENTLAIIKHYKMNRSCFVGHPPSFHYMLAGGTSPVGPFAGEDCRSFNTDTTGVREMKGGWKVADGDHVLFDFGANRAEAEQSLAIIKKYGFTHSCMMARGKVDFVYLHR
jgi:hypothetical protein